MVKAMVAPDADVMALFPKDDLRIDTHSSGEEGMLGVDVADGANISFAQAYYDCVGLG
jgi:hypothetical protein